MVKQSKDVWPHHLSDIAKEIPLNKQVVYYVGGIYTQLIKIGTTRGFAHRLSALKSQAADTIWLLAYHPGGRAAEKKIHARFEHARDHGEWFRPVRDLVDWIVELRNNCRTQNALAKLAKQNGLLDKDNIQAQTPLICVEHQTVKRDVEPRPAKCTEIRKTDGAQCFHVHDGKAGLRVHWLMGIDRVQGLKVGDKGIMDYVTTEHSAFYRFTKDKAREGKE